MEKLEWGWGGRRYRASLRGLVFARGMNVDCGGEAWNCLFVVGHRCIVYENAVLVVSQGSKALDKEEKARRGRKRSTRLDEGEPPGSPFGRRQTLLPEFPFTEAGGDGDETSAELITL